jgi:glycogen debranching enzyme
MDSGRPTRNTLVAQTVRALCRLGHVRSLADLGTHGPLDASAGRNSAFACLFGRDSVRMALDLLEDFPAVGRVTIKRLTALQGLRINDRTEEEPGRIVHEHRSACDPHAAQPPVWDFPYYGAVDTTSLYVVLIGAYCRRYDHGILAEVVRGRDGRMVSVARGLERAVAWIEDRVSRHGYIAICRAQPHGIQHQFWEDSYDSQFLEDGRLLDDGVPYASIAVQGYAYDALLAAARLVGDAGQALHRRAAAAHLRQKVLTEFWLPELGTFAPALVLDGAPATPVRVVASSPGHLLAGRLLDGVDAAPYRERLVARLLAADMLSTAGVRTKSTYAARFAPGSYHNGSVWPVDTGVLAGGLRRHGYRQEADDLDERILTACAHVGSPVEFFRGDPDDTIRVNATFVDAMEEGVRRRREQPPQAVQGWTATRLWRILRRRGAIAAPIGESVASRAA